MTENELIETSACCGSSTTEKTSNKQKNTAAQQSSCCGSAQDVSSNSSNVGEGTSNDIRTTIRDQYTKVAEGTRSLNDDQDQPSAKDTSKSLGYSSEELETIPEGSNLGLGSGHPVELANIQPGETVVDLGSGAGIDCFLSANRVGPTGLVIGVDMTPAMIDRARTNKKKDGYSNVEFRLGEIEHMPIADNTADVIISNCVINLAPDKSQVFRDALRVLKPGGRLVISDILLQNEFPDVVRKELDKVPGCVSNAVIEEQYLETIRKVGFESVEILTRDIIKPRIQAESVLRDGKKKIKRMVQISGKRLEVELTPEEDLQLQNAVMSAHIRAIKPQI